METLAVTTTDQANSVTWTPFAQRLTRVLEKLAEGQCLIVSDKRSGRFVQFQGQGSDGLRAETVSNHFLPRSVRLDRSQQDALVRAGWQTPTGTPEQSTPDGDPHGSPNFFVDFPAPIPADRIAHLAVATLAKVLQVPDPGSLEYDAFASEGGSIALPELELTRAAPAPIGKPRDGVETLRNRLLRALRKRTGLTDLKPDADGDIAILYGSAVTFGRARCDPPGIEFFSPLVCHVPRATLKLFRRLNALNSSTTMTRFFWADGTLFARAELPAAPWSEALVVRTFEQFSRLADDTAENLQAEFGGELMVRGSRASSVLH